LGYSSIFALGIERTDSDNKPTNIHQQLFKNTICLKMSSSRHREQMNTNLPTQTTKMNAKMLVFPLALVPFLASCEDLDDRTILTGDNTTQLSELLAQGEWRVAQFIEDGRDQGAAFDGYVFHFTAEGQVSALRDASSEQGTWRVFYDDGRTELSMSFNEEGPFEEMTDDWYIMEFGQDRIHLEDDNALRTDLLIFSR